MDASDAAEFVQDLAGEDANIIFGAMYDDSRADEATITVIATGLHNVGGTSSKLKSRLEGRSGMVPPASSYDRQLNPAHTSHASHTTHAPRQEAGAMPSNSGGGLKRPMGGTTPSLDTPRTPTSKVKEQSIKIPDFFKK